jgi:hypothetical protein
VKREVDSVYKAKGKIAKVNLKPFEIGTKAFKEGKREEVVDALSDLEAEEQKVKDRYSLVQQTWRKIMMTDNQDSLFQEEPKAFSVFGGDGGGNRLAEETEKISQVKAELAKSANQIADRKFILRNRLERMSARVPPEHEVPRHVEVLQSEEKKNVISRAADPKFVEDIFKGGG